MSQIITGPSLSLRWLALLASIRAFIARWRLKVGIIPMIAACALQCLSCGTPRD